jgi:predicted glycosyltransferase
MSKPAILIYRLHSEGIGKLLYCLALAKSLRDHFQPVVLNCCALPRGVEAPAGVEVVEIPGCEHFPKASVVNIRGEQKQASENSERRDLILQLFADLKPEMLLIDTFPLGESNAESELLPLLEQVRNKSGASPRIICCVQDIPSRESSYSQKRDDRTARLLEKYFDMVLVHTDPSFARLEEYFQPKNTLSTPVHHTGFILPGRYSRLANGAREHCLLVSAGGGATGGPLFRAAIESHRLLWDAERLPMTIVTGPKLPEKEWTELHWLTRDLRAITIKRSVPNLGAEMNKVRWSVSQCGYGAATEAVASGVAALFVPSSGCRNSEQADRARRLAHWGAGRLLVHDHLNGVSLANEVLQLMRFTPRETNFSMSGLANSVALLERASVAETGYSTAHVAWREPLGQLQYARVSKPVSIGDRIK